MRQVAWNLDPGRTPYFGTFTTGPDGKIYSGSFFDEVQGVDTVKLVAFEGDAVPNAPGTIQFGAFAFSVNEEEGSITIPITRTGGSTGAASASFSIADLSTTAGSDYTAVSTTVSFPAGIAGTRFVTIPIASDGVQEAIEVATLNLTGITGAAPGSNTSANLTIVDSDSPPEIILSPLAVFAPPFEAFQLEVGVLSGSNPVTYQWQRNGVDIPGATAPLYLVTEANAALHDGSYTVVVTNPNGSVTSAPVEVVVKEPAELGFASATLEALESDGSATLTLSRGGSSVGAVSADVIVTGGDATNGFDFAYATQTVAWADGDTTDQTITITLTDDSDEEAPETIIATLTNFSLDAIAGSITSTTLNLLDDDSPAIITRDVEGVRAVEGWAATFSVEVDSQSPVTYRWFKDGVILPNETTATLEINAVAASDAGRYSVEITNGAGTLTSGTAELGLRPNPLVQQPILGTRGNGIIRDPISRAAGGYYIPGSFSSWVGAPNGTLNAQRLVRILPDGTPDPTFTPQISSSVSEAHERSDGSVVIIGSFTTVGGLTSRDIAVLNPDGTVNATFAGNVGDTYDNLGVPLEVDRNDRILVRLTTGFLRLNADGTPDNDFVTTVESNFDFANVTRFLALPNGGYYLSGSFRFPGENRNRSLVRVFDDGTLDPGFAPANIGNAIQLQSDGRIIYGTSTLRRLNTDGTEVPTFTPITGASTAFTVAPDDMIYLQVNNGGTYELRRYDPNGNRDTTYNNGSPVTANQPFVPTFLENGNLYLDGNFTIFNGQPVTQRPVILFGEFSSQEITTQPMLVTVDPAGTALFTVAVSSAQTVTYQWRRNGVDLIDGGDVSGATSPGLTIANAEEGDEDVYDVVITNNVTGSSVTSRPANLIVLGAPEIASQPTDRTLIIGDPLELTVSTFALAPYTVQWFKTGEGALAGETSEPLIIDPASASDSGRYYAVVTNDLGSATSDEAIVQVIEDPAGLVAGFIPATGGANAVRGIAPDGGGGALITGGYFSLTHPSGNGQAYLNLIDDTGAPVPSFTGTSNQSITATAYDGNGGFIVAGINFFLNGNSNRYLERIDANGQTDASFATNRGFFNSFGNVVVVDGAGNIYLGGNGFVRKLAADGTPDNTYNPVISDNVEAMALGSDRSKLYLKTRSAVMILNPDGTRDASFTLDPAVNISGTTGIGVAENGSIAIGAGSIQSVYLLNPEGSLRSTLPVPGMTSSSFSALAVQANGKVVVGYLQGDRLIRLLPDGTQDPLFNVGTGPNGNVNEIKIQDDGTTWVGGNFTSYNGSPAFGYLRLNGDPLDLNINNQPTGQIVDIGQSATFSVVATTLGAEPITYQWRRNGIDLTDGGDISGATTNTLTIANAEPDDEADYDVIITNETTGTEKTTLTASLTVQEAPEILVDLEPALGLEVGEALNLTVSARGAGELSFQWQRDGSDLPGDTAQSLSIDPLDLEDSGSYQVVINNNFGSITSAPINVTVVLSPTALAPDWSDLNFSSAVRAVLPLPDGRTLIGGTFSSLNEGGQFVGIDELVLLNANGSVDRSFDLSPNGAIYSLSFDASGRILVGGQFNFLGENSRRHIARLNEDLTLDLGFDTSNGPANTVWDVEEGPDGKIYVGGQFNAVGGDASYAYLCRLNPDSSLDPSFVPPALNTIYQVVPTADGKVVAGGVLNVAGRRNIVRLNNDGSHDSDFGASTPSSRYVYALLQMPDGGWLAGTRFGNLYRYDSNGTSQGSFPSQGNQNIWALALEKDGQILVGGNFTSMGGEPLNRFARLNPDGTIDSAFTVEAGANGPVYTISLQPLGQIWIGGQFTTYRNGTANELALLNGAPLDLAIVRNPTAVSVEPGETAVFTVSIAATDTVNYQWQRNGIDLTDSGDVSGATTNSLSITNAEEADEDDYRVIITHSVTSESLSSASATLTVLGAPEILGQPEAAATEAGLDATFSVNARGVSPLVFQWFRDGVALSNGGGISGATTNELTLRGLAVEDSGEITVRVSNSLGSLDSEAVTLLVEKFPAGVARDIVPPVAVNSTITDVIPFDDGSYIIGGAFSSLTHTNGAASQRGLARFNPDGSLDPTFPRLNNSSVEVLSKTNEGKVYVGGSFTGLRFGGAFVAANRLIRLNADGSHDTSFDIGSGANNTVRAILPLDSGKLFVAGNFSSFAGQPGTAYVALLNEDGSVDPTFVSQGNSVVEDLALSNDGTLWIPHSNNWNGQTRLVRVNMNGTVASGYNHNGSMNVTDVVPTSDGGVLCFSNFFPYQQKVAANGTVDTSWALDGRSNNRLYEAVDLGGGRTAISGQFNSYGGTSIRNVAVIDADGSLVAEFDPGESFAGNYPTRMKVDSQGRLWCVGPITTYQGEPIPRLVVLNGFGTEGESPLTIYLTNAGVPEGQQGPGIDFDGDGWSNLFEFLYGSDPANPSGGIGAVWNPVTSTLLGASVNATLPGAGLDPGKDYRTTQVRLPVDRQGLRVSLEAGLDLTDFGSGAAQALPLGPPIPDGPDFEI